MGVVQLVGKKDQYCVQFLLLFGSGLVEGIVYDEGVEQYDGLVQKVVVQYLYCYCVECQKQQWKGNGVEQGDCFYWGFQFDGIQWQ